MYHCNAGVRVKEERPDDAEINELAAKMVEANRAKLAATAPAAVARPTQGQGILGYLNKPTNGKPTTQPPPPAPPTQQEKEKPAAEKPPIDLTSQRGI
jgi:outer membrane biosynthesis protein TonB